MFLYIFGFFTLGMLGVWLLLVLYTMVVKPKEGSSSGTFVRVLKRSGVLLLVYVVVVIVGEMIFSSQYTKECSPNKEDVKVMTPQAEVITNYILENGIPESLMDIPNLPYSWNSCSKATDGTNVERCYFNINKSAYSTELYILGSRIYMEIYNKKSETGIMFGFKKQGSGKWGIRKIITPYSTKNDGICNPMKM